MFFNYLHVRAINKLMKILLTFNSVLENQMFPRVSCGQNENTGNIKKIFHLLKDPRDIINIHCHLQINQLMH